MRSRQVVWSDPEVQQLSKEFITVADEVYMLYPEDPGNLERVKNNVDHTFFKRFGAQVPKEQWNHPGTKQGIYMMGPDAEYLQAKFATSDAADIRRRLREALQRWDAMKQQKGYANKPVPKVPTGIPEPRLLQSDLLLQVNLRDLPRQSGAEVGARYEAVASRTNPWTDFGRWAYNENWIGLNAQEAKAFVPSGSSIESVDEAPLRRIARQVLVDNVRGQAPEWKNEAVKDVRLSKRRTKVEGGSWRIEYRGEAKMEAGSNSYHALLYGQSLWDPTTSRFMEFELVALGPRTGKWQFNNRERDLGPAPMGVSLKKWQPEP